MPGPLQSPLSTGLDNPALIYLIVAAVCLVLALHLMRRALAPIGALVQAVAAAIVMTLAVGTALVFIIAVVLGGF